LIFTDAIYGQKGKYCITCTFPKGDFSAFPKNHVGFAPKNIKINTHKIEIDCECGNFLRFSTKFVFFRACLAILS
jgi:hypothetical protein